MIILLFLIFTYKDNFPGWKYAPAGKINIKLY